MPIVAGVPTREEILLAFGQRVRQRRLEQGLSQEALAHECGMHRTYVSSLERGERNIGLENITRIAASLHSRPGDLMAGVDNLVDPVERHDPTTAE